MMVMDVTGGSMVGRVIPHSNHDTERVMDLLEAKGLISRAEDPQAWHWLAADIEEVLDAAAGE